MRHNIFIYLFIIYSFIYYLMFVTKIIFNYAILMPPDVVKWTLVKWTTPILNNAISFSVIDMKMT